MCTVYTTWWQSSTFYGSQCRPAYIHTFWCSIIYTFEDRSRRELDWVYAFTSDVVNQVLTWTSSLLSGFKWLVYYRQYRHYAGPSGWILIFFLFSDGPCITSTRTPTVHSCFADKYSGLEFSAWFLRLINLKSWPYFQSTGIGLETQRIGFGLGLENQLSLFNRPMKLKQRIVFYQAKRHFLIKLGYIDLNVENLNNLHKLFH